MEILFDTERLVVRRAAPTETDVAFFVHLWNHSQVMHFVGFPQGLGVTPERVQAILAGPGQATLDARLVAQRKENGTAIGECKLGEPDAQGLSETDVKLLPEYWGQGYGVEIKRGLLRYLFTHTNCNIVQATPNIENTASVRMQEAVGGKRVGSGVFEPQPGQHNGAIAVRHYTYHVRREDWLKEHE